MPHDQQGPAIDLRSDTVTEPSEAMREAMVDAQVGDDVLDHDPTMAALEEQVACLVGTESALWVPSGSMSNLIAMLLHLQRGDRYLAPAHSHVIDSELGTAAWLAGGMPLELPWKAGPGCPDPADVARAAVAGPYYALRPALLSLENTHNHAGGAILDPEVYAELVAVARETGLAVHLDGARIWHAAAALGVPVSNLTAGADTVSVCLSKGLGAPVGSVLCGPAAAIDHARRLRKMLGGGVRQGGVLAAAGLVALRDELPRIDTDRVRAVRLAAGLRDKGYQVTEPQTNIVLITVPDAAAVVASWASAGVRVAPMGENVRAVLHRDITDDALHDAISRIPAAG